MKAEERKRLQKNALRQWLEKTWATMRSGSRSLYLFLGLLVLIVAGILGWRWYASSEAAAESALWLRLDNAADPGDLEAILLENPDSMQGHLAKHQWARMLLGPDGVEQLGTTDSDRRQSAIENIGLAREKFQELIDVWEDQPVLRAEAIYGVALAEESLVGIPQEDDPDQWQGDLDTALEGYRRVANDFPDSTFAERAAGKIEAIEKDPEKVKQFYIALNRYMAERIGPPIP